jgi:transposase-like protein
MAYAFSQSKAHRDFTIWNIVELSEEEAHEKFVEARWGGRSTIACPGCGAVGKHYYNRVRRSWRCKACDAVFSVTTGTAFANRRLKYKKILMIMYFFVAAPKSVSANQAHAELDVTTKTAYLLFGKMREALWNHRDVTPLNGVIHIDGGHFCGKPRRPRVRKGITSMVVNSRLRNRKAGIVPPFKGQSIEPWNLEKLKNRRVVVVLREVSGIPRIGATRTRVVIVKAETANNVLGAIRTNVARGATIMTDESSAYSRLSAWFNHRTVKHAAEYSTCEGINQNQAESFMSRLRRAEYGVFHGMRCQYFALYANEMAWREDMRNKSLGDKFDALIRAIVRSGWSRAWRGYNQGHRLPTEYDGLPEIPS